MKRCTCTGSCGATLANAIVRTGQLLHSAGQGWAVEWSSKRKERSMRQSVIKLSEYQAVFVVHILHYGWNLISKLVLGCVYFSVITEGLRLVVPPLGQKLHNLPGLHAL